MLPSQRALFDIPDHVCYLNAARGRTAAARGEGGRRGRRGTQGAALGDRAGQRAEAVRAGTRRRGQADQRGPRRCRADLIGKLRHRDGGQGAEVPAGSRVLLLEDDHSSPVLEWLARAAAQGFIVEMVERPDDGDWTAALLATIERQGAPRWVWRRSPRCTGRMAAALDLERVAVGTERPGSEIRHRCDAWRRRDEDRRAQLDPDFLVFPTYKWVLGPYGRAFLYVARRWQDGVPIEQAGSARRAINSNGRPTCATPPRLRMRGAMTWANAIITSR